MLLGWSEAVSYLQSSSRCWKRCCLIIKVVSFSVQYGIEQHNQYVTKVPSLPGKLCVLVRKCLAISCIPNRFLDSVKWGCRWFQIQASTTPGINTAEISAFATRCVQFHGIKTSVRAVWIHSHSLQFGSFAADLIPQFNVGLQHERAAWVHYFWWFYSRYFCNLYLQIWQEIWPKLGS